MSAVLRCAQGHSWTAPSELSPTTAPSVCPICGMAGAQSIAEGPRAAASEAETLPPVPTNSNVPPSETATLPHVPQQPSSDPQLVAGPGQPFVAGYEIQAELGRGGMGVVYKARQLSLKRLVALKMIRDGALAGPEFAQRFRLEAEAVACLRHPNIVQIYEIGTADGRPYFSLEYLEGGTLAGRVNGKPQPPRAAAQLVETVAHAVHHAHQQGIIHRDLKPANILLTTDGTPKITDFGLAKQLHDPGQTQSGAILGTPSYMAPEQAGGKNRQVGPAVDIYALGAILYELLTGRPPFLGDTPLDTLLQVISLEPVPVSRLQTRVPTDLETICLKCLDKRPDRRYRTAEALAEDLHRFLAGEPIRAVRAAGSESGAGSAPRFPVLPVLLTLGVCVAVGLVLSESIELQALYLFCAVAFGTLLVCQFLLSLIGIGEHHDLGGHGFHGGHDLHDGDHGADHASEASWLAALVTVRSVVVGLAGFGLAGLAGSRANLGEWPTLLLALATGGVSLVAISALLRSLYRLEAEGTVHIEQAVGKTGAVYLCIPGHKAGLGKVMLNLQNRTVEYQAATPAEELPTGCKVVVVSVISHDTVEVVRVAEVEPDERAACRS